MMAWGHFRENDIKIAAIKDRVKKDGLMPEPTALPPAWKKQEETMTKYLNKVVCSQKASISERKAEFHRAPLHGEPKPLETALPIEKRGQDILEERKTSVQQLAKDQANFSRKYDAGKVGYQKGKDCLHLFLSRIEEEWETVNGNEKMSD